MILSRIHVVSFGELKSGFSFTVSLTWAIDGMKFKHKADNFTV